MYEIIKVKINLTKQIFINIHDFVILQYMRISSAAIIKPTKLLSQRQIGLIPATWQHYTTDGNPGGGNSGDYIVSLFKIVSRFKLLICSFELLAVFFKCIYQN